VPQHESVLCVAHLAFVAARDASSSVTDSGGARTEVSDQSI
jgi:hypothetical protein